MILADTSARVEYDRATGSVVHRRVAELIAADGLLAVTEPVIMEVLAGACSDQRVGPASSRAALQAPAVRCCSGLRFRSTHLSPLPHHWVYSARYGGVHDRSSGVAARASLLAQDLD